MVVRLSGFLERRSPSLVTALGFTLLAAVASLDYHLDYRLSFFIVYLIPIAVITLYAGRAASVSFCALTAGVMSLIAYFSVRPYPDVLTAAWNTGANFAAFLLISYLLRNLKSHLALIDILQRKDELTGVLNLRGFRDEAQGRLLLADRYGHPMALGRVDLEGFKALVNAKGRMEGAAILKEVADVVMQCVRATDIVGRLGDDEFIVFLPETDYPGAQTMFKRIHEALDRHAVQRDCQISFNISVAAYKNAPASVDEALQYVDRIMYRLKQNGKMDILYEEQIGANWAAYHDR